MSEYVSMKKKVLYLTYDGLTDPLGQSQVLSYIRVLSGSEFSFHIISFEKKDRYEKSKDYIEDLLRGYDIQWHPLPYKNTPPVLSTIYNLQKTKRKIKELLDFHHFDIVHCRGYITSLIGEWLKRKTGCRFIFDMRGWWADEKKEAGDWASFFFRPVYNYFKRKEKSFFKNCDCAVSLTNAGKRYIVEKKLKSSHDVEVIPTCVNFELFPPFQQQIRDNSRLQLDIPPDVSVMVYSGSLGGNYRTDIVLQAFKHLLAKRSDALFLFVTHSSSSLVEKEIEKSGIAKSKFRTAHAEYKDVHQYLMVGDIGVVMYSDGFSVIGRSPTKLGEYWACGLKVLSVKGIGDMEYLIDTYSAGGVLVENMDNENAMATAIDKILNVNVSGEDLRNFSVGYFDLQKGCSSYLRIYRRLMQLCPLAGFIIMLP